MNTYYIAGYPVSDELYHHGIKGQRWGIRRYQNPDGTLTLAGKARYGTSSERRQAKLALSTQRGENLIAEGRSRSGSIARGIGRQAMIVAGQSAATGVLAVAAAGLSVTNPALAPLIYAGAAAVKGGALGLTGANIARTVTDYRDISRAEGATFLEKGGSRR